MSGTIVRSARVLPALLMAMAMAVGVPVAGAAAAPSAGDGYELYFGDLHAHTSYSDGARGTTPWDAFAAAADAGADFMGLTDHQGSLTSAEWADTMAAAAATTADAFVALAGYEAWVTGIGEINVFGTAAWPAYPTGKGADKANSGHHGNRWDSLPAFYDWLAGEPTAVGQWNHPTSYAGVSSEDFIGYDGWTEDRDAGVGIIEVFNDIVTEASYVRALDAGWHVMPSANSDTHAADWISGSEVRTVLLAASLTPADLLAAMRAGRGYATLDADLAIRFTVNGEIMGSVLDGTASTLTVRVIVDDPDPDAGDAITLVEIVGDGGAVLETLPVSGHSVDVEVAIPAAGLHYVYARVSTASGLDGMPGVTAWTAPVWTGD